MENGKALVFDIKRFAVHDGSGIRTTVFFKGCGMRCRWCQNPEGLEPKQNAVWLENTCLHCGTCAANALPGQMEFTDGSPRLNHAYAGSFDHLIHACPSGAIRYDSRYYTAEELMAEIRKDEVFFRHGGGVTFSGGEPLLHGAVLVECLKRCREEGIRTAIESALYADTETLKQVIPLVDEFFADFKCADPDRHREITGVSNERIKEHLKLVLHEASNVTIRTPLIPDYTASVENISAIAAFLAEQKPDVHYELLNYNELAPAKYPMTGRVYEPGQKKRFSEAEMENFRNAARSKGLTNVI